MSIPQFRYCFRFHLRPLHHQYQEHQHSDHGSRIEIPEDHSNNHFCHNLCNKKASHSHTKACILHLTSLFHSNHASCQVDHSCHQNHHIACHQLAVSHTVLIQIFYNCAVTATLHNQGKIVSTSKCQQNAKKKQEHSSHLQDGLSRCLFFQHNPTLLI